MNISPKLKNILIVSYVAVLALGAIFVKSVISDEGVQISQKEEEKSLPKPVEANISITIISNNLTLPYSLTTDESKSVIGMLDQLQKDNKLSYEKTEYTYGTEIDNINGQIASDNSKWAVMLDGKDVTTQINELNVQNGKTYEIKIIQK